MDDAWAARLADHAEHLGWCMESVREAVAESGGTEAHVPLLFPYGAADALRFFLTTVEKETARQWSFTPSMKVREKIAEGVQVYLHVLHPFRTAWIKAWRTPRWRPMLVRHLWSVASTLWYDAGDTSTDFNHYTKRGLLVGVLHRVLWAWMAGKTVDTDRVNAVLHDSIDRTIRRGQFLHTLTQRVSSRRSS